MSAQEKRIKPYCTATTQANLFSLDLGMVERNKMHMLCCTRDPGIASFFF